MSSTLQVGDIIPLHIDRLATGGYGVGRFQDGIVVFVPFTAPNEDALVKITELKKKLAFGELVQITKASPVRIEASCAHYGQCGGCNWQHISYDEQLRQKQEIIQWLFKNFQPDEPPSIEAIVPAPNQWNYRRRIQLHNSQNKLGFLRRSSHEVIDIKSCPITRKEILEKWPTSSAGLAAKFEIGISDDGQFYSQPLNDASPEFTQINFEQNENLKKIVQRFAKKVLEDTACNTFYDLYCGAGNFAFALAEISNAKIVGVDVDRRLIEKANEKTRSKGLTNLSFVPMSDDNLPYKFDFQNSCVVVDPPRAGCSPKLLQKILKDKPLSVIYVSCHAQTAVRDFKILAPHFKLKTIVPLDMFPQTDHVEIVGLLR